MDSYDVAGLDYHDIEHGQDSIRAITGDNTTLYLNADGEPGEELLEPLYDELDVPEDELHDAL